MYRLILLSRSPKAKIFKRWIVHEVLPSIRKLNNISQEEAFIMLNKERQKEAMENLFNLDKDTNFPKVNSQVNYITSKYCGLDKTINKSEMPNEVKDIRQNVMDDYLKLKNIAKDFNLDLNVYDTLKEKYNVS